MLCKARTESVELLILKFLNTRMSLTEKEKQHYYNLKKGYEGEILFDSMTEKLECDCLIINDLLLKHHNSFFQIDTLIILPETVYFFEVKNYEGDYYYESEGLYLKRRTEVNNPLNQLNRSESLLRQLLQNLKIHIPIHALVVFINPEFTLYQTPLNIPFIFPTQINRLLKDLNATTSKLNRKHKLLAEQLISLHIHHPPFALLPSYDFDQLQKGISCSKCSSLSTFVEGHKCVCRDCGHKDLVATAVMRSVREFKLLFPDKKITTNVIHKWCKVVESRKRIKRILEKNFQIIGVRQCAFYE